MEWSKPTQYNMYVRTFRSWKIYQTYLLSTTYFFQVITWVVVSKVCSLVSVLVIFRISTVDLPHYTTQLMVKIYWSVTLQIMCICSVQTAVGKKKKNSPPILMELNCGRLLIRMRWGEIRKLIIEVSIS